ncbi:MAG: hypothetical protein BAA01_07405 [Bacillus thermozeamaize]|jgi:hypothetical protein|uniref:ABC-2 type transporter domain-containing protein n=1 Tax=Bacillus thermozeamaize TaxID=230954 RepID=A0A1Y3PTU6_9BACI|nr:MAG: hypothetical protein BAA01_07405 [Bacillus thermozeamaize]
MIIEFRRLFKNKITYKSLCTLLIIVIGNVWAGMTRTFSSFYYFIFPLLIALPIVDAIYRERTTGNLHYQIIRMSRFSYYLRKFLFIEVQNTVFCKKTCSN